VTDPVQGLSGAALDVRIEGGLIIALEAPGAEARGARVVDVSGLIIVPGLIDLHTHLREPGFEYKETIATGTAAAAAGGFTAVCCMANTEPVNDSRSVTEYILRQAASVGRVRVYPVAAVSKGLRGEELAEYGDLKEAGAVALSDDGHPVMDSRLMRRAMEYAAGFGLKVIDHAEDLHLASGGAMNEGRVSTRLGLPGIPAAAEEVQVARDCALAEMLGLSIHIAHVSTEGSLRVIAAAKARGVPVTAETAPHYLTLTEEAVAGYDTNFRVNPPLRTEADVAALRRAVAEGIIDCVATDHAPHSSVEKDVEFEYAASGTVGLETALPICLALVEEGVIDLGRMVGLLSASPAAILGLPGGSLEVGGPADVTVIDPRVEWIVERATLVSRSANSAFLGRRMKGRAVATIVGGRLKHSLLPGLVAEV
jgi:dihydroorotase